MLDLDLGSVATARALLVLAEKQNGPNIFRLFCETSSSR